MPIAMFYFGRPDMLLVLKFWAIIIATCSFMLGLIGLNAGHHHPGKLKKKSDNLETFQFNFTFQTLVMKAIKSSEFKRQLRSFCLIWNRFFSKSMDFGIFQLCTVVDRREVKKSQFWTLITFGHHTLHHMFPTIDHGLLPQLHEIFIETCHEFKMELREFTWWPMIYGQFQQLNRTKPKTLKEMKISLWFKAFVNISNI